MSKAPIMVVADKHMMTAIRANSGSRIARNHGRITTIVPTTKAMRERLGKMPLALNPIAMRIARKPKTRTPSVRRVKQTKSAPVGSSRR
jgi:hypothetical protein